MGETTAQVCSITISAPAIPWPWSIARRKKGRGYSSIFPISSNVELSPSYHCALSFGEIKKLDNHNHDSRSEEIRNGKSVASRLVFADFAFARTAHLKLRLSWVESLQGVWSPTKKSIASRNCRSYRDLRVFSEQMVCPRILKHTAWWWEKCENGKKKFPVRFFSMWNCKKMKDRI